MSELLVRLFVKDYKNVTDNAVRQRYGIFTGVLGVILNIFLFAFKLAAGFISGAISVVADAFNNLSDAGSCIISVVGVKLANKPVDRKHPFGHGRMEYLAGLIVSILIIIVGAELLFSSVENIIAPKETEITTVLIIILSVSVAVKLWMFYYNRKFGKRVNSAVMRASAIDSISDVSATLAVLICAVITRYTGVTLDAYAGLAVAAMILFAGIKSAKETVDDLLGVAPDGELLKKIEDFVTGYEGILGVHDIIVHNYGVGRGLISLHAEVPANADILTVHDKIDEIENAIFAEFKMEAVIHTDPVRTDDTMALSVKKSVIDIVSGICGGSVHDFRMIRCDDGVNLIFDLVIPYECKEQENIVLEKIISAVKSLNADYRCIIKCERPL